MKGLIKQLTSLSALVIFFLMPTINYAQQLDYHQGQIIVQLEDDIKGEDWIKQWREIQGETSGLVVNKQLSRAANIYLLDFDYTKFHDNLMLRHIKSGSGLVNAQFNHFVQMRSVPNDEQFSSQWQYINEGQSGGTVGADIDADLAWDITTGGVTLTGDTIVVAVLDDGIDIPHEDLQKNRWINHAEIPDNDIDDDNNGYTDDYLGWSIVTNDDNIDGGGHGTPVAGIIGADGNNEIGVAGISWNVKVMVIKNNFNTNEAQVLEAYSYALEQRMRYNESGGAEGAFVVATNASWGVNQGNPEDAPIWCEFYNVLGEVGILNCGATANANFNIDVVGDLPTACSSDYLIAVTNVNRNDMKVNQAGYGLETIDLGAFGAETFTLDDNNSYGGFGGTSGATPHVTGTIGLLYSLQCPRLMGLVQADPGAAALLIKDAILNGTDPNASLEGITVTGGRLNVMGSINQLLPTCDGCIPASSISHSAVTDVAAQLNWVTNDSLISVDIRWRAIGDDEWTVEENTQPPLALNSLLACQDYEYQFQSNCFSDTIVFGNSTIFQTDGCCLPPENLIILVETEELVSFTWDAVLAAQAYQFSYKIMEEEDWLNTTTTETDFVINELEVCARYEYRVRTICLSDTTDWTPVQTFLTPGCGPCLDLEYCIPSNIDNSEEHIARVEIGGLIDNMSGESADGYIDYGSLLSFIDLEQGRDYFVRFTPGFSGGNFSEAWRVWLDVDHNGIFTSSPQNDEVVFSNNSSSQAVTGFIQIPADANLGVTRMRILMIFNGASNPCTASSEFGEVEDYCINIVPTTACVNPSDFVLETIDTTSATLTWDAVGPAVDYELAYRLSGDTEWTGIDSDEAGITFEDLQTCSSYIFRVKTLCFQDEGLGFSTFEFETECAVGVQELKNNAQNWAVLPNPFYDKITLEWSVANAAKDVNVVIHDAFGQQVLAPQQWLAGQSQLVLKLDHLPAAVYTLSLIQDGQLWSAKRVIRL